MSEARRIGGDWVENTDPGSGKKYYANVVTQETRWTWPDEIAKEEDLKGSWVDRAGALPSGNGTSTVSCRFCDQWYRVGKYSKAKERHANGCTVVVFIVFYLTFKQAQTVYTKNHQIVEILVVSLYTRL